MYTKKMLILVYL